MTDKQAADQAGDDREEQIHRADVFVVGREKPALKERRRVVVIVGRSVCRATHGV